MARMAARIARVTGALGCAAALLALAACSDGDHRGDGRSRARDAARTVKSDPDRLGAGGSARSATPTGGPGAAAAPVWGFARFSAAGSPVNAPTAVPAAQSSGSWRTAGGAGAAAQVTVVRRQTGGYRITFPGIAVAAGRGAAIVTALDPVAAVGTTAPVVSCHVVRWGAAGRDEQVDLTCRDAAGAPADSGFTALFSHVPDTAAPSPGGAYAYLRSDAASAATSRPANAYSVSGPGTIEVHRVGAGHYTIDLTGPAFAKNGNNLQVNAIGDGPVGCSALGRVVKKDRQSVFVGCARGSAWTDSPFVLLYTSGHALIPTGAASFGHAFTGVIRPGGPIQQVPPGPPVNAWAWYSANSTGATNQISRVGVGRYQVTLPGISRTPSSLQVTPYGEPTARCAAAELPAAAAAGGAPAAVTVAVRCVDAAGRPADSYASVAYVSAAGP
ncbi:hypothetical protein [Frankia sp. QA3]|uniref:hypothetical protein n=1 Tax=Frankia sp. QA3 TaxID=710111 RepID=UPI000269C86F|nr:hypothetical protein [Frankia sp. QA3]EIV93693.1 hypothetical protein FraQA3DRAFT_3404 [Frankia sp. QA3]